MLGGSYQERIVNEGQNAVSQDIRNVPSPSSSPIPSISWDQRTIPFF